MKEIGKTARAQQREEDPKQEEIRRATNKGFTQQIELQKAAKGK